MQRDGEMRDVYADPLAARLVRGDDGRATAAKWIERHVARIAAGGDDAFEQCNRFLRGIAESFLSLRIDRRNVYPNLVRADEIVQRADHLLHALRRLRRQRAIGLLGLVAPVPGVVKGRDLRFGLAAAFVLEQHVR